MYLYYTEGMVLRVVQLLQLLVTCDMVTKFSAEGMVTKFSAEGRVARRPLLFFQELHTLAIPYKSR